MSTSWSTRAKLALLTVVGALAVAAPAAAAPGECPSIPPTASVTKGMVGEGWTVSEGTTPEQFDIEVLGVLPNRARPRHDHGRDAEPRHKRRRRHLVRHVRIARLRRREADRRGRVRPHLRTVEDRRPHPGIRASHRPRLPRPRRSPRPGPRCAFRPPLQETIAPNRPNVGSVSHVFTAQDAGQRLGGRQPRTQARECAREAERHEHRRVPRSLGSRGARRRSGRDRPGRELRRRASSTAT